MDSRDDAQLDLVRVDARDGALKWKYQFDLIQLDVQDNALKRTAEWKLLNLVRMDVQANTTKPRERQWGFNPVRMNAQDSALNQSRRWDDLCSHIQFMAGLFRPYCVYNRHTGRCCPDRTTATLPRVEADARDSVLKPRQRIIASTSGKKKFRPRWVCPMETGLCPQAQILLLQFK